MSTPSRVEVAKNGMQETRSRLVVQRKSGDRRIKERDILEPQAGILRVADIAVVVEVHFRGAEVPVPVARLAGRVGGIEQRDLVLALELGPFRRAAGDGRPGRWRGGRQAVAVGHIDHHRRAGGRDIRSRRGDRNHRRPIELAGDFPDEDVIGLFGKTDLLGHLHAHPWRIDLHAVLQHAHIAGRVDFVVQRPVGHLVAIDPGIDLAQLDLPGRHGHLVGPPFDLVGDEKQRIGIALLQVDRIGNPDFGNERRLLAAQHIEPALAAQAQRDARHPPEQPSSATAPP